MLLTMKLLEAEFQTNANKTGLQTFRMVCQGTMTNGKHIYIYQRKYPDGKVFGYEVVIPSVKKAGTYPLPGDKTITYTEDFEEYPGASVFGFRAWFCSTKETAEKRYNELMEKSGDTGQDPAEITVPDTATSDPEPLMIGAVAIANSLAPNPTSHRGRPKVDRPSLLIPVGEFSTIELAEYNKVDYPVAVRFIKESGLVKFIRSERRNAKGKETNLFTKV